MLTRPLQAFRAMLANIRGDHFRPDESRTSRLVDIMKLSATATAVPEAQPADAPPAPILDQGDGVGSEAVPATPVANDAGYVQPAADGVSDASEVASTSSDSSQNLQDDEDQTALGDFISGPVSRN
jgi:hypothetical protein